MGSEAKLERLRRGLAGGRWNPLMIMDAILESSLSTSEKVVLMAIASHRSEQSPRPSPGVRRLARLASTKTDTVVATVNRLESRGLVRVDRRDRQAHTYDLGDTAAALLAVLRNGTGPVPTEGTEGGPNQGTDDAAPTAPTCPDSGVTAVPPNGSGVSQMGERKLPREATKEATSEKASQSSAPLTLTSPEPSKGKARTRPKASRRWTRVPADFQPKADHEAIAKQRGLVLAEELAKFRDHDFARPKSDADAAFRNWLRGAFPQRASNGNGQGLRQKNHEGGWRVEQATEEALP